MTILLEDDERRAWIAEVSIARSDPGHWVWTRARELLEEAIDMTFAKARIPDYRIDAIHLDPHLIGADFSYRKLFRRKTGRVDLSTYELQQYFRWLGNLSGTPTSQPARAGMQAETDLVYLAGATAALDTIADRKSEAQAEDDSGGFDGGCDGDGRD